MASTMSLTLSPFTCRLNTSHITVAGMPELVRAVDGSERKAPITLQTLLTINSLHISIDSPLQALPNYWHHRNSFLRPPHQLTHPTP